MSVIKKFSISDLTVVAIRCNTVKEVVQLEDFLFMELKEETPMYNKYELSPIFSVIAGKKSYFANGS
jgi:hypothetical protein